MNNPLIKTKIVFLFLFIVLSSYVFAAGNGKIIGVITEAGTGEKLFGANVSIVGTTVGSVADINGHYAIMNLDPGTYIIKASYIGYKTQEVKVELTGSKTVEVNFAMVYEVIEGEVVTVTAQREGQLAAINQQIQSDAIKNIVSSDKIQQLPEANAAEAVGRLSGISLLREGGEGAKVVIRGLAPQYNKVQIDGVDMASTESDNRSTDLSMISAFLLNGIEVTKSAMADQEANQLGGTVNFSLKGAPYQKPTYQLIVEGAYNGLRKKYSDYKIVGQHSRRFLDNAFGVSVNFDIERANRSSNSLGAGYHYLPEDKKAVVNSFSVQDVTRELNRYGGSLILDYKNDDTDLRFSLMGSKVDRINVNRNENISSIFDGSTSRTQNLSYSESSTLVYMGKLALEQYIGAVKFDVGASYSFSDNDVPEILSYGGLEATPLEKPVSKNTRPEDVPSYMKKDLSTTVLNSLRDSDSYTKETEFSSYLDALWEYNFDNDITIKVKTGLKYEHKEKNYDYNTIFFPIQYTKPKANTALLLKYPWMAQYMKSQKFPYLPFIDQNYDPGDFMAGTFTIERIPQLDLGREMIKYLQDYLGINWNGATEPIEFTPDFHASKQNDYNGNENYYAAYIMPTINIGKTLTFIPGFRYEKNTTSYTGIRGNANLLSFVSKGFVYRDTTITRSDNFFLPMLHARYKPFEGFDIRLSYTHTLARPNFDEFIPSWYIAMLSIDYKNPHLKTSKSENIDLYFSFYGNKIGLLTIGGFIKNIDDLVFSQNKVIIDEKMAIEEYGLKQEYTGQKTSSFVGKQIYSLINNPNTVKVKGIEVEWQSNLWFLPGLLQNFVFSVNYTYTESEVKYPKTKPITKIIQSPFGNREVIVGNEDVSYIAPLLMQPDHILNITLGYDYKDFSIRTSMQYKSDIFSSNDSRPELRGNTDAFTIYDLSISQKLPIEGMQIFGNIKNISKTIEGSTNVGTGFMSDREYYGMSAGFGLKYQF